MFNMTENILLVWALLLYVAVIAGKVAYRFGAPALLLFLGVGMMFGLHFLKFESFELTQFIGMIALCIILFSGGMDTKFSEIRPILAPGIVLATLGVVITAAVTGVFIYFFSSWVGLAMSLPVSLLLASTMASTDSASVFSILRTKKQGLKENLRPLLELESGSNDPMAYMLTILLVTVATSAGGDVNLGQSILKFVVQMVVGALLGYGIGRLTVFTINRIDIKNNISLYSVLLLASVFFSFSFTSLLWGNGYLAVYITGLVVGNYKIAHRGNLTTFMDGFTWLAQIVMFITIGLLVNSDELMHPEVLILGGAVALFLMFVARPLAVFLGLLPFRNFSRRARIFVSWVGLRGAVPIIFATYPVIAGIDGSQQLFNIVFFITLLSLVVQGMSISSFARWLHLDLPEEKEGNEFGVELPDEIDTKLEDMTLTTEMLAGGNRLKDMNIPKGSLVMLVKRGNEFIIPNGQVELHAGDKLLFISENKDDKED